MPDMNGWKHCHPHSHHHQRRRHHPASAQQTKGQSMRKRPKRLQHAMTFFSLLLHEAYTQPGNQKKKKKIYVGIDL
jgi:hypothetical protein